MPLKTNTEASRVSHEDQVFTIQGLSSAREDSSACTCLILNGIRLKEISKLDVTKIFYGGILEVMKPTNISFCGKFSDYKTFTFLFHI